MPGQSAAFHSPVPELCLRFRCAHCDAVLSVPVAQLQQPDQRCPSCAAELVPPTIDRETAGVADILERFPARIESRCPHCNHKLAGTSAQLRTRSRCPGCRVWLTLKLVEDPPDEVETVAETPNRRTVVVSTDESQQTRHGVSARDTRSARDQPSQPADVSDSPVLPRRPLVSTEPEPVFDESAAVVYHQNAGKVQSQSSRGPRQITLFKSPRAVFLLIYFTLHGSPFLIYTFLIFSGSRPPAEVMGFVCPWTLFGFYPSRRIARLLTPLLVSTFHCPHCHEEYEAVGRWTCGCGFTDHRERHVLRFRCPKCDGHLGYYNCDRCGSTIILRSRFG